MDRPTFPNESAAYRKARDELLEAEAALRQRIEDVAALRRALPLGGVVKQDYVFEELGGERQPHRVRLSELFAPSKHSLFLYSYIYGPNMKDPCTSCTSILDSLNGNAAHMAQWLNLAVVARSPIERVAEIGRIRNWTNLRLLSSADNSYHADYFGEDEDGNQWPMANVFVQREGAIHHFWGSELLFRPFQGGDMRHLDLLWPLWNLFDLTPEGRGGDWYPKLSYDE